MNNLTNQFRQHAANIVSSMAFPVKAIVDTVDPNTMTCVVRFQPEDITNPDMSLSQPLPISCVAIGAGFGFGAIPNAGDQVFINFEGGDFNVAVMQGAIFDNNDAIPPQGLSPGDYFIIHKSGSFIKLTADNKISINGQLEVDMTSPTINLTATVAINLNAPAVNMGALGSLATLMPLLNGLARIIYNTHTHDIDLVHPEITLIPNEQMDDTTETVNVLAT